jgi:hypothetical protein
MSTHTHTHTHTHTGVLFIHNGQWYHAIFREMGEAMGHNVKWNKPDSEREISIFSLTCRT